MPTEPVLKQQDQVIVVFLKMAVVQRLRVVGIGAGVEQQRRERVAVADAAAGSCQSSPRPNAPVSAVNA